MSRRTDSPQLSGHFTLVPKVSRGNALRNALRPFLLVGERGGRTTRSVADGVPTQSVGTRHSCATRGNTAVMLSLLFQVVLSGVVAAGQADLERLGGLDARLIPEASGIVKSRRFADTFWVHNDSGNPPELFAIRSDGRIIRQFRLAIPNVDWEDIAIDDEGHLYLGDIGNNTRALPVRAIYRIDEPDPRSSLHKPLAASSVTFYAFPDGKRFDAESLWRDGRDLMLLTKVLDRHEPELFAISLDSPSTLFRPTRPRSLGRLPGFTEPATEPTSTPMERSWPSVRRW